MTESIADLGLVEDEDIELGHAALRLAALDHPDADVAASDAVIARLADEVAMASVQAGTTARRAAALRTILADKHDYRGDSETYDADVNADLICVIDRRRGLPVALAILYVAIARRLGWTADVLNTPGHIVIALGDEGDRIVLDPFNGGRQLTPEGLQEVIKRATGSWQTLDPSGWVPMENRAVLVRLVNNLAVRALGAGALDRAALLYERLTIIAPTMAEFWWERAKIERRLRHNAKARACLSALMETTIDPAMRREIRRMLDDIPHE
jgi:regulator of sirC expression with transglutaminase-like and TPR domain